MIPLTRSYGRQFKRDFQRCEKRRYKMDKLDEIIDKLANRQPLEARNRDHELRGDWEPARECHITPDWLLVYRVAGDTLELLRTGTHSDLGF